MPNFLRYSGLLTSTTAQFSIALVLHSILTRSFHPYNTNLEIYFYAIYIYVLYKHRRTFTRVVWLHRKPTVWSHIHPISNHFKFNLNWNVHFILFHASYLIFCSMLYLVALAHILISQLYFILTWCFNIHYIGFVTYFWMLVYFYILYKSFTTRAAYMLWFIATCLNDPHYTIAIISCEVFKAYL